MTTVYASLAASGAIATVYGCSQAATPPPGYVEMPDSDPRYLAWQAATARQALVAYAEAKQGAALAVVYSHALSDGSATLTTACDPTSVGGINSLMAWATTPQAVAATPTRNYFNSDWTAHTVTPAQMIEFGVAVGAHVSSLYADLGAVIAGINAGAITTAAQIDDASWTA